MQSTSKRAPNFYFILTGILILIQVFLLILANRYWPSALLAVIPILLFLFLFHICFYYLQAKSSFFQTSFHASQIPGLIRNRNFFTVKNGEVDQDYFLLKTKPRNASIYIHPDSAAVVLDHNGDFRTLGSGFHVLRTGEKISSSFDLKLQTVACGPEKGENPFAKRKSGENYTSFHARQLRAQTVRCLTSDQQEIYPSFEIRYCLRPGMNSEEQYLAEIARFLSDKNQNGPVVPALNTLLCGQISAYWSARISKASLSAILSGVGGNSLYQMQTDINAQINSSSTDTPRMSKTPLGQISGFNFPFIRVYLTKVWYLEIPHNSHGEHEGTV